MENKLTDVKIKAIKPADDGSRLKRYSDGHGLNLVVSQSGGKWWEYRFRFEGKEQTLSLGTYPVVGLAEARKRRLAAQMELEAGQNPAAEKQARKRAKKAETLTFEKTALFSWIPDGKMDMKVEPLMTFWAVYKNTSFRPWEPAPWRR